MPAPTITAPLDTIPEPRPPIITWLGSWCFDHRRTTIGLWLLALVVVIGVAGAGGPEFASTAAAPASASSRGLAVLEDHFPELGAGSRSGTIVFRARQGVRDPEVVAAMKELFALVDTGFPDESGLPEHPGATVISPYTERGGSQIAQVGPLAGQLAYAQVNLSTDLDDAESGRLGEAIAAHAPIVDGLEVVPGGRYLALVEPPRTELVGLAFAIVVLILAFGSVLAMGLPIAVGAGGVGLGIGATLALSNVFPIPEITTLLATMVGLGVGIDYALFVVTRYREGLHAGRSPREATRIAMGSAGRAVVFAGSTVVVSILGLLLVGIGWLGGIGIGISVTVLATMITSVTLLPALLGFAGARIEVTRWRGLGAAAGAAVALLGLGLGSAILAGAGAALAAMTLLASTVVRPLRRPLPSRPLARVAGTYAYRWSRVVQRHPRRWLVAATAVLAILASPTLDLRLGWSDEGNFPEGTATRRAYDLLAEGFGAGFNGPVLVTIVPGPGVGPADVAGLRQAVADTPGVATVTPAFADDPASPSAYVMTVIPTTGPQQEATTDLVGRLRDDIVPATVSGTGLDVEVTGSTATNVDITHYLARRTPLFFGTVLALSFVLLAAVFRSLLVPLKAVVVNLASIAAACGVVVAVSKWGWAGGLLGIDAGPVNPFVPMMLFAVVFGLSMDYEVFMLSRIREAYHRTGDAAESVADGLAATARVITAAAGIMVVVFSSFALEDDREIKQFGIGLAVAVLLDATLVRMLLVPSTMALLGDRNWWIPAWLDRLLPRLNVEGAVRRPNSEPQAPEPHRHPIPFPPPPAPPSRWATQADNAP